MDEEIMTPDRIKFTYKGKEYTLEFDRHAVAKAERTYGIDLTQMTTAKLTLMQDLFAAAFIKHHQKVKRSLINEIFYSMDEKVELYQMLVAMYSNVANSVLEDSEEGNGTSWTTE